MSRKGKTESSVDTGGDFLGYRTDIPDILAASDIVALVSSREGLPRSVREVVAAGKPVVCTEIRGNRDLIRHGENGFLVRLGNVGGLARALETLMRDRPLRERMGRAGQTMIQPCRIDVLSEMKKIHRTFIQSGVSPVRSETGRCP